MASAGNGLAPNPPHRPRSGRAARDRARARHRCPLRVTSRSRWFGPVSEPGVGSRRAPSSRQVTISDKVVGSTRRFRQPSTTTSTARRSVKGGHSMTGGSRGMTAAPSWPPCGRKKRSSRLFAPQGRTCPGYSTLLRLARTSPRPSTTVVAATAKREGSSGAGTSRLSFASRAAGAGIHCPAALRICWPWVVSTTSPELSASQLVPALTSPR